MIGGVDAIIGSIQGTLNTIAHPINTFQGTADSLGAFAGLLFTQQGRADIRSNIGGSINFFINSPEGAQQLSNGVGGLTVGVLGTIAGLRPSPRPGSNPFLGKSAEEIAEMFKSKGFEPRGPDPIGGRGGFVNPKNGRSYHIDFNTPGHDPHVDINRLPKNTPELPKKRLPAGGIEP